MSSREDYLYDIVKGAGLSNQSCESLRDLQENPPVYTLIGFCNSNQCETTYNSRKGSPVTFGVANSKNCPLCGSKIVYHERFEQKQAEEYRKKFKILLSKKLEKEKQNEEKKIIKNTKDLCRSGIKTQKTNKIISDEVQNEKVKNKAPFY